jgi:hypothetical protein
MVAHACNPSYLGGGDWEDGGSSQAESSLEFISINKEQGEVVYTCHPSYSGSWLGNKHETLCQKQPTRKVLSDGSEALSSTPRTATIKGERVAGEN